MPTRLDIQPHIQIVRLEPQMNADIPLPRYMTPISAGMDVCAAISRPTSLLPGAIKLIPTGFAMAIPEGYEAQVRPRSGLAVRHGIGLINSPGTVDADYRGEIKVALINHGQKEYIVQRGDRIAQIIIARTYRARLEEVKKLENTSRGTGGFGHTGIK